MWKTSVNNVISTLDLLKCKLKWQHLTPTPHVCTNMSNKLQSSASLKAVVKLHIRHLDFFFFSFLNVWMNLACKGLGWTSELHPYSLSLSIQNIVFWKQSLTPQTCPDFKIVINWFIWGRCRHEVFCLFVFINSQQSC